MTTETREKQESCHPISVTVELKVVVNPPSYAYGYTRDIEQQAANLEQWARELQEFVRDHRSQDPVYLGVERVVEEVCSSCKHTWDEDDGVCSWCGTPLRPEGEGGG